MEKAYKYRIYPSSEQETLIQKTFGCCRYVYNRYLGLRIEAYEADKTTMSYNECSASLTELKKEIEWLREVDSIALQSTLKDLEQAYQNLFRRLKTGEPPGFPKFKSKHGSRHSYKSKNVSKNIEVHEKAIKLPKLGIVECRVSKELQGRIISATVSQKPSGKYYVSVCCTDVAMEPLAKTEAVVGVDLGISDFAATSDEAKHENHKYLTKSEKKLNREQRRLSRKPKGSQNRNKSRVKLALVHEKVANQRADFLHKLSTGLVRQYDVICAESLKIKNMVKNRKLAKAISDASWGEFVRLLEYKCRWHGKYLVRVPQYYASSQICHVCGHRNAEVKDLQVREWICPECGANHDRDVNAAKNILSKGMEMFSAV
jgi:putative transposase